MKTVSYNKAIHSRGNHYILCNNIPDIDQTVWENFESEFNSDNQEIYQWYISDCSEFDIDYLIRRFSDILFTYSELLDLWVLCVTHYGTSWDNVFVEEYEQTN